MLLGPLALLLAFWLGPVQVRDLGALVRHLRHRQGAAESVWRAAMPEGDLADIAAVGTGSLLALRQGGLGRLEGGAFQSLTTAQGLLRIFPGREPDRVWLAGSYQRVLSWDVHHGLRHTLSVRGAIREIRERGDLLAVGFEGTRSGEGHVAFFRRQGEAAYLSSGLELQIGLERWSGFDLSPDGQLLVANLPGGRGVGVWSTTDGQLRASWPCGRLARILLFLDGQQVVFDRGPDLKGADGAYANPGSELVKARFGDPEPPTVLLEGFATVLASALDGNGSRLAFADLEGILRVVHLGQPSRPTRILAPRGRSVLWRLRFSEQGLWVLQKGPEVRVERFSLD